ncbi:hypothetical protein AVEN_138566-1 [Araneus ventricosus]|uniref:Uncharacterized protein n=1 Tax=Araneus ventricosus TaxID=182803 RepID=A0A4Y2Q235_ARAVE|nr:hypothetical protein AVEN_138566-1 [Araneus ventricosus]
MFEILHAIFALHRRTMDWRIRWKTHGVVWISAAAQKILATKSISDSTGVLLKSEECGGQATVHHALNDTLRCYRKHLPKLGKRTIVTISDAASQI